jgi:ABC-type transport system substrate-binding protein
MRAGLVEMPKKNIYFVMFHRDTPPALRRALASASRVQDLVWGTLGRFALPATGLLPPGILGHDPGRRQSHLSREKAVELIREAGIALPARLRASVHPILLDQYAGLTEALLRAWKELGVEVEVATRTMAEFIESWHPDQKYDLSLGRWIADYDDPDNFTFTLFHSGSGAMRGYFSSPETDRILEEARSESRPAAREALYRRFEQVLLDAAIFLPLFHDVDYRIGGPRVVGLQLRSASPYVNYAELGKSEGAARPAAADRPARGGTLHVPIQGVVRSIDPAVCETQEQAEVVPSIFETLTRAVEGARIVPRLASEVIPEADGRRYRFRLRPGVSFHDGRRLTARDVRFSWERLLASGTVNRWLLSSIRGARRIVEGEATDLEGFHIVSPMEFSVDLETPMAFFPAVIAYTPTSVIPEGTASIGTLAREAVGTGPFRLVRFEPGKRLDLERNPHYWRQGYPRSDGLVFRFGVSPEEARADFLAGRVSVTSELLPADVEALRHDPRFASGYHQDPSLVTYFAAFNRHRGPLRDPEMRRGLCRGIAAAPIVRRTLSRLFLPAHGLIPPGLLGYSAPGPEPGGPASHPGTSDSSVEATVAREPVELTANVHPIFFGEFSGFFRELVEAFQALGFSIRPIGRTMAEYMELQHDGEGDLSVGRWNADYADADNFVHTLLHSDAGFFGKYVGSPELNELAERGRSETNPGLRDAIYRQVEEVIVRDALLLPLFYGQTYCFTRPEVEGLGSLSSNPVVSYEDLWIHR